MPDFPAAMPHGPIEEVFPDVFVVQGTMRGEFFGSMWQFGRNMTVVREGRDLVVCNSVRLSDAGLASLDALGRVKHVVRLGEMHGTDDAFYVDRYHAPYWGLPGMTPRGGLEIERDLSGGELPLADCSVFTFRATKYPEAILRLDREGGILIACDSLLNWVEPDPYVDAETEAKMRQFGFFAPTSVGPAWMHENEPKAEDFVRLKELQFRHVLCGHGFPAKDTAREGYHAAFARLFGV